MNPVELPMAPTEPETPAPAVPESGEGVKRFRVEGMDCAACAKTVEKTVNGLDGVQSAQVSFGNGLLVFEGDVDEDLLSRAVSRAGYRLAPTAGATEPKQWWREARGVSLAASVGLLVAGAIASLTSAPRTVAEPLYIASMVVGGWPIARAAAGGLRRRSLDMNVLMALAAVGAVGIGAYAEGAWVLVLFAFGTWLETWALNRSRRSVQSLMELTPQQARIVDDGDEHLVPVDAVEVGQRFLVRPGERIPLDGVVEDGLSAVDQAPITGESVPAEKEPGSDVFAGTLNVHGALMIRTTKLASASTLATIAELVEQAQGSKSPSERFVDRFARIYTPAVFIAALLVATVPLAFGGTFDTWLYRALALLIVACPCSLVISVPVAVVSAVGGAARLGVLIKGGQALEDLGRVTAFAMDKTGTLTTGSPKLSSVQVLDGTGEGEALALAAAVESGSEHPLGAALRCAAADRHIETPAATGFAAKPGIGAEATVHGRRLWVAGPRGVRERTGDQATKVFGNANETATVIALGEGDRVLAVFALADEPRPEAAALLERLRATGVERVVMLTGDTESVARSVSETVGITDYRAGLLPEDKLRAIENMREGGRVAMVGDGINDAPALAAADVGIAMGAAGSDAAIEVADVALMGDRLDLLPDSVRLAQRALRIMRFNVIASLAVKGIFVVLAPFGLVTLVIAVAADMGMSLLVTANAMRLLRIGNTPVPETPVESACADGCCSA